MSRCGISMRKGRMALWALSMPRGSQLTRNGSFRDLRETYGHAGGLGSAAAPAVDHAKPPRLAGPELAARLEVTTRTVRNDIERLRRLGYPVDATAGVGGGYRLGTGAVVPPLLLDDEEAVAVAVGLRTAANASVTGIEEASVRALAKLQQLLPAALRRRVSAVEAFTVPAPTPGPTVDADTLTALAAACRDQERVRFDYRRHDGAENRRDVEPHRLVNVGRRWY